MSLLVGRDTITAKEINIDLIKVLENIVSKFDSVSLEDLDKLQLINRHDTKFLFSSDIVPDLLMSLSKNYNLLEVNTKRIFNYENVYFDTEDLKLFTSHHNGKLNRYKVRYRHYCEVDKYFFELKFKSNKKKTFKDRFPKEGFETHINGGADLILEQKAHLNADELFQSLKVIYKRITLVNKYNAEKVTIDTDIKFLANSKFVHLPALAIAEIKHEKRSKHTDFHRFMQTKHIHPHSLSKYCLGILLTNDDVKYNSFKSKLRIINRICDGYTSRRNIRAANSTDSGNVLGLFDKIFL